MGVSPPLGRLQAQRHHIELGPRPRGSGQPSLEGLSCLSLREESEKLLATVTSHPALQRLEMNYLDLSPATQGCWTPPWHGAVGHMT